MKAIPGNVYSVGVFLRFQANIAYCRRVSFYGIVRRVSFACLGRHLCHPASWAGILVLLMIVVNLLMIPVKEMSGGLDCGRIPAILVSELTPGIFQS